MLFGAVWDSSRPIDVSQHELGRQSVYPVLWERGCQGVVRVPGKLI